MKMRWTAVTGALGLLTVAMSVAFAGPAASGATRSHSGIPSGFRAQSQTWVAPRYGWMLGVSPCGRSTCTTVVATTDGGGTWNTLSTLNAPLTSDDRSGVTTIRFADGFKGWAFGPALWATRDGGVTWRKQSPPGGGHLILAIAGDPDAAYMVVSGCRFNQPIDQCTDPATLWRRAGGDGTWRQVPVTLPVSNSAVLAMHGIVAYLIVQSPSLDPDVLDVTVDGHLWSSRPDPCVKAHDEFLTDVAPISDTRVALLCVGDPGFSKAVKRVLRSNDTGQTTRPAGTTPLNGIVSSLAAAPNGTLVVSSWSDGSWIYRNSGGQNWSTQVSLGDGGQGWNDIVFTTGKVGFVVHGPAQYPGPHPGELWETHDGGVTWGPV